ncbi:Glutamate receptor 4 [Portunus trituberculatus]|uniref:Glutamate receptor 4 n=1 Tax=Portunus trituberculatus TaxID=210409 RepID=A0A5B7H2V7_PORTR|nr:Glutamate receptor 4 [Portunus trituberculatus]
MERSAFPRPSLPSGCHGRVWCSIRTAPSASRVPWDIYELITAPEPVWGGPDKDGNWNGMLGVLQRGDAEFAIGPFTITPQRETICDMSVPISGANKDIMMERPRLRTDMAGFLKAFTLEVRVEAPGMRLLAHSSSSSGVTGAEVAVSSTGVAPDGDEHVGHQLRHHSAGSLWLPPHDTGRVLVTTWLLASLVFMSSYSGILTAMLTLPRIIIPIDSLTDLVAQDEISWRLEGGSSLHQYFRVTLHKTAAERRAEKFRY